MYAICHQRHVPVFWNVLLVRFAKFSVSTGIWLFSFLFGSTNYYLTALSCGLLGVGIFVAILIENIPCDTWLSDSTHVYEAENEEFPERA